MDSREVDSREVVAASGVHRARFSCRTTHAFTQQCCDVYAPARLDFPITCGASSSDFTAGTPVVQPKWTIDEDELRAGLSKRVRHSAGG